MSAQSVSDRLDEYRDKRQGETPEPSGDEGSGRTGIFVVQHHAARREHWDLRLEIDGVLESWAVPKGPSLDPTVKRLAVRTEPHPVEYADFEGRIPEGTYGAGAMIVWDRGRWELLIDPAGSSIGEGKLLFDLHGFKLRGRWTLVRTSEEGSEWLLVKKDDAWARREGGDDEPSDRSVLSGLTVGELARGAEVGPEVEEELRDEGLPETDLRAVDVEPMLARGAPEPFSDPGWLFELKYDGFRAVAGISGSRGEDRVALVYRSGRRASELYPEVARALAALPYRHAVFDGELVVLADDGSPDFRRLQRRGQLSRWTDIERATVTDPCVFYVFDCLAFGGRDLRGLPLRRRKEILRRLVPSLGYLRYADHVEEAGEALFAEVARRGLEGVIAKRAESPYASGRSSDWLKVRADHEDEFLIVGFRPPEGRRRGVGSLELGAWRDGELVSAGRVGSGIDARASRRLEGLLRELVVDEDPLGREDAPGDLTPVAPRIRCSVRFKEWPDDGHLRQPVFVDVCDEPGPGPSEPVGPVSQEPREIPEPEELDLSNLDKVFWPGSGLTKGDLLDYYRRVAEWILPYLDDRPLVLDRYPDGIEGTSFYQKNAPDFVPPWIGTVPVWSEESSRTIRYPLCDSLSALLYFVNLGTIPFHVWASREASLERPDWTILDLDPKEAPFEHVVLVAREIEGICRDIGLPCFPKTSGASGLHVLIPTGGRLDYEQSRTLASLLGRIVVERRRDVATMVRSVPSRRGRVYVDVLQNRRGQLLAAPYSVRPRPGATVSTPLRWHEVTPSLDPGRYTILSVPRRMAQLREDPMARLLRDEPDLEGALGALADLLS